MAVLENAWVIPLIPAASFFLILLFGKRLPWKGSELGIAAVGIAFVLALVVNVQWFDHVDNPPAGDHSEETDAGHADEEEAEEAEDEHALAVGESAAPVLPEAPVAPTSEEGEEEAHAVE
ncbi:MAG TPA: hypothetical protein VIL36_02795, partial [Acidimicrobiales bacterium]